MNNTEIKLNKLIDIIRKDTGINNTMDAMEQLSAILLLQYYYEVVLVESVKEKNKGDFKSLFYNLDYFNKEKNKTDFSKFKNIFRDLFINEMNSYLKNETSNKIEYILDNISFRIRSAKILEILLSYMEDIEFNEQLAEAYDKLLVKMINESISSGAFYSPKVLTNTIVEVIKPSINQSIYDPALGTGRFLIEAQRNISKSTVDNTQKLMRVYGQDISPFAFLVGSLNLLLNGMEIENISLGDSLLDDDNLQYDIILSAVPFGKISNIDKYEYYYKDCHSNLETMFLKLSMKKLAKGGKSALIVPNSLLFNSSKKFLHIREELLTEFNLHSILSLPSGILSPYTGIKLSVLFFDNSKIEDDIWFYELNTDKPLNKLNQINKQDFEEFIELFPKRTQSQNSYLVNKQDILNTQELNLALELPKKSNDTNNFQMIDELSSIKNKNDEFNKLVSKYSNLVEQNKKVDFQNTFILNDIVTLKSGKALKSDNIKTEGKYPVYGGNGIRGYYDEYNHEGENIIIGRVGAYCGNVHFTKEPIYLTNNSFILKVNLSQKVYSPYLVHILRSMNLNELARGSAIPAISYAKIKNEKINLPSYKQQVELSEWFEEIENQKQNLSKSLKLQEEQFNKLTNHSIISNCIKNK